MSLSASVLERRQARRDQLAAEGRCVKCQKAKPANRTQKVCAHCYGKAKENLWRWKLRQRGQEPTQMGQEPKPRWNFDTDDLILQHIGLAKATAYRVASTLSARIEDREDMVGDALYGLVEAGRLYADPSVPFAAYARKRIKGEVFGGIRRRTKSTMKDPPKFVSFQDWDGARR